MPTRPDWRLPNHYENLRPLDRAGMAWEFLRRNPKYKKDFSRAVEGSDAIARRWGLCFRLRS